jgi:ribonuclease J
MIKEDSKISIIPLGGLGEVGRNMTLIEYQKKILIIDAGVGFPQEDTPGIDFVIPDISYLKKRKEDIVGMAFTHGHYDHIGAIPYIIDGIGRVPMLASDLTREIIIRREKEFSHRIKADITLVKDKQTVSLPPFKITFIHQVHNIPANFGLLIETPGGNIFHTGDFKFDENPVNDTPADLKELERIGKKGILLLMSDSTSSEDPGHSLSEKVISENIDQVVFSAKQRIVVATFASLINRIQQVITSSEKHGRKVTVIGRSMKENVEIAQQLGYIKIKPGTLIKPEQVAKMPRDQVTIICTGSQAESKAALLRIANNEDRHIKLDKGDVIAFSSSVIPGNERTIQALKDRFYRQGLEVIHYSMMDIHAGGHGRQEELAQMIKLMNPKYFMPIHGYCAMLVNHKKIAMSQGIPEENIAIAENGQVIEISPNQMTIGRRIVPASYVFVDGLGVGDVGEIVLRDRQNLATDGMFVIIVTINHATGKVQDSPDIISRGFIYLRQSKQLLKETRQKVVETVNRSTRGSKKFDANYIKANIRDDIGAFLFDKTERRPMVLPVVIKI